MKKKKSHFYFRFLDYRWRTCVFKIYTLPLLNGMSNNKKPVWNVTVFLFRYENMSIHAKKRRCRYVCKFCYESWGWGRGKDKNKRKTRKGGRKEQKKEKQGRREKKLKNVELFCILSQRPHLGDRLVVGDGGNEPHSADPDLCQITSRPGVLKLGDLWTPLHY